MTDNKAEKIVEKPDGGVVYRSELYAKNCKGMLPFRIEIVEKNCDVQKELWIKRIDYSKMGDKTIVDEKLIMSTFWKEEA